MNSPQTVYDAVGGDRFFEELVSRFYDGVAGDAGLLALYPRPDDLTNARRHLTQFLIQYWGGPTTYSDLRGHPRLRMRHMPFAIGRPERDAWIKHMAAAVAAADGLDPSVARQLMDYFANAADHLINVS